jgi:hypothetical protein
LSFLVLALTGVIGLGGSRPALAADPPIAFFAMLSPEEESVTTVSPGSGRAEFSLDRDTLRLSWRVAYRDLTSPATGVAVHGPQRPGTNAGVQIDLAPAGTKPPVAAPLRGSTVLTEAQLEYLLSGRMYVNVRTTQYPAGELRGQIERQPPPGL